MIDYFHKIKNDKDILKYIEKFINTKRLKVVMHIMILIMLAMLQIIVKKF